MLTITETAREFIRRIPANPMLPSSAGLRISRRKGAADGPLNVTAADKPKEGDEVLECDGGRVFLGAQAVKALQDKLLDARLEAGRIQFTVTRSRHAS